VTVIVDKLEQTALDAPQKPRGVAERIDGVCRLRVGGAQRRVEPLGVLTEALRLCAMPVFIYILKKICE
jgi:hypothetical protein